MSARAKVNPVLECCTSLFAMTAPFKAADRGANLDAGYRETILAGFEEMERMAFERQLTMQIVKDAKYAMAAYIDECVLSSDWPGRLDWMGQPLQLEFFGDHLAGEGFFERLGALRQRGEEAKDVLELYYVCLQMGFEGIYRVRGIEQLMALQVDLHSQIDGYGRALDTRLAPDGAPSEGMLTKVGRDIPYWVIVTVAVGAIFFGYAGYSAAVVHKANTSVDAIKQMDREVFPNDGPRAMVGQTRRGGVGAWA